MLGTIYTGLATPTESAALGAVASIVFAMLSGRFWWKMMDESARATAHTTAFVGLILCGAYVLQGMRGTPGPITDVFHGVIPFMAVYVLAIVILMIVPELALWLPRGA